ncbi:hypothetical protein KM043_011441 [Ampulex compressa]|nr:hypothetical protein KM043_011441 [Ampulex compressa]
MTRVKPVERVRVVFNIPRSIVSGFQVVPQRFIRAEGPMRTSNPGGGDPALILPAAFDLHTRARRSRNEKKRKKRWKEDNKKEILKLEKSRGLLSSRESLGPPSRVSSGR